MSYTKRSLNLSHSQIQKLKSAIENETPISFSSYGKKGNVPVYLTKGQLKGLESNKPIKFSKKQLGYMKVQGGFIGSLIKLIGPAIKALAPVAKAVGPVVATGALSGAASYGANRLLRKAVDGKGFQLKPHTGGNVTIELTPCEINGLIKKKNGGFLPILASIAASLLPTLLGNGLSRPQINDAKNIITRVGRQTSKKKAQAELDKIAQKYGSGLLGKLFGLPGNKVPVLGDIPLLNVLF